MCGVITHNPPLTFNKSGTNQDLFCLILRMWNILHNIDTRVDKNRGLTSFTYFEILIL